ncbi:hypothetical protein [Hymenobacter negativus]|uniref:hypothetical protein n=1 Tax=Hymenobacter negativus TaxID=2795026 RepID=UPI001AAF0983|nr:hypothetical protein [Hymenobacter negativus]
MEELAGFLAELTNADKKVAMIKWHVAAIAKAHELAGLDSLTGEKGISSPAKRESALSKLPQKRPKSA